MSTLAGSARPSGAVPEKHGWGGRRARGPVVGVLGCMAERLKDRMLDRGMVDVVAGPDSYRDLPRLLAIVQARRAATPHARQRCLAVHGTFEALSAMLA